VELKEKNSLISLLNVTKEKYQVLSKMIHWSVEDVELLDNLLHLNDLRSGLEKRIINATGSRALLEYVPLLLVYKAWQRTKAVYSFNQEFVEDMMQTGDTSLYISLLDKIPFKDMLFFFPDGTFPKLKDEETAGIFVHIEKHPEGLWAIFNYYDRKQGKPSEVFPGILFDFPIINGMKISQIFETEQYLKCTTKYKKTVMDDHGLNEKETEERMLAEKKALNAAVNLLYYLSAENADVKPVKQQKKPRKTSSKPKSNNALEVKLHEVGSEYAEIIYRRLKKVSVDQESDFSSAENINGERAESEKINKKKRPHARRAHWQHYWTGKGRTTLVLRWKNDLFVGANREDQAVIVYDVEKDSLKGKKNPNTSKKKRGK